jgi:hypothetical protein
MLRIAAVFFLLSSAANAASLTCQDQRLLDAVRRSIAQQSMNEAILHMGWYHVQDRYQPDYPQCIGQMVAPGYYSQYLYGWRTFEGKTYAVWQPFVY